MQYATVTRPEQLAEIVQRVTEVGGFAFDVETMGTDRGNPRKGRVTWLSIATDGYAWAIPMGHPNGELIYEWPKLNAKGKDRFYRLGKCYSELNPKYDFSVETHRLFEDPPPQLSRIVVFRALRPIFFSEDLEKVGHNVKFDIHAVSQHYPEMIAPPYYDTHIAAWLKDVTKRGNLKLDDLAEEMLGMKVEKGVGKEIERHAFSVVAHYGALDAHATWLLYRYMEENIFAPSRTLALLRDLEMSVLEPVLEMEANGTRIDTDALAVAGQRLRRKIRNSEEAAMSLAGRPFNINSNPDKQQLLYNDLGLKPTKLTPGGRKKPEGQRTIKDFSVDHESLEALVGGRHTGLIEQILAYQKFSKLYGTYVVPYVGDEDRPSALDRGRIHTQFVQTGAESGRFSSRNPNLQNVPSRSEDGRLLREVFVADDGEMLVVADYSQIEPRIIASLSGDKTMIQSYLDGGDVYQTVADRLGVTRPVGKELVLSIAYGVGPAKISARTGLSQREAKDLMTFFAEEFRAIPRHKASVIVKARRTGYAETVLGRRRRLPHIRLSNYELAGKAERQAYNHRIQGSAADVMKLALVGIYDVLPVEARMLMTVHDEVVVSAPEHMAEEVGSVLRTQMEAIDLFTVPLVASVGIAHSWGGAH